jgi:hypothetical protein
MGRLESESPRSALLRLLSRRAKKRLDDKIEPRKKPQDVGCTHCGTSPEGWCLRIFRLVVKNPQTQISYNAGTVQCLRHLVKENLAATGRWQVCDSERGRHS